MRRGIPWTPWSNRIRSVRMVRGSEENDEQMRRKTFGHGHASQACALQCILVHGSCVHESWISLHPYLSHRGARSITVRDASGLDYPTLGRRLVGAQRVDCETGVSSGRLYLAGVAIHRRWIFGAVDMFAMHSESRKVLVEVDALSGRIRVVVLAINASSFFGVSRAASSSSAAVSRLTNLVDYESERTVPF
jgi:hypothetical protein